MVRPPAEIGATGFALRLILGFLHHSKLWRNSSRGGKFICSRTGLADGGRHP